MLKYVKIIVCKANTENQDELIFTVIQKEYKETTVDITTEVNARWGRERCIL